ncbi:group III truncated hemoglobin [Dokdonia sp. R86516]|uniref:group III truncated hemoglobin n=1 Tax=Dokdonia sp. R86516 TaxID=3093856 RepID=UPI0037CA54A9
MRKEIKNREDVYKLVTTFYGRIRSDVYLGPIFNKHITDWPHHFEHLTDFWEGNLFQKRIFTGRPLQAHKRVDRDEDYAINEQHFGVWLNHWVQTVDELYEGDLAEMAKFRARKIGTFFLINMFQAKPKME